MNGKKTIIGVLLGFLLFTSIFSANNNRTFADDEIKLSEDGVYQEISYVSDKEENMMVFNTEYFFGDNSILNPEIAKCSVGLATAMYPLDEERKFDNIHELLNNLGFSHEKYEDNPNNHLVRYRTNHTR